MPADLPFLQLLPPPYAPGQRPIEPGSEQNLAAEGMDGGGVAAVVIAVLLLLCCCALCCLVLVLGLRRRGNKPSKDELKARPPRPRPPPRPAIASRPLPPLRALAPPALRPTARSPRRA